MFYNNNKKNVYFCKPGFTVQTWCASDYKLQGQVIVVNFMCTHELIAICGLLKYGREYIISSIDTYARARLDLTRVFGFII